MNNVTPKNVRLTRDKVLNAEWQRLTVFMQTNGAIRCFAIIRNTHPNPSFDQPGNANKSNYKMQFTLPQSFRAPLPAP